MNERIHDDRFTVGLLVALLAGSLGIVGNDTVLFMASVIGLTFAAYGYATTPPSASFALSRTVTEDTPTAGQDVEVAVTLRNTTDSLLPDVRIVDGVPEGVGVVEGTPRHAASLQPGEETTFSYVVRARRGQHEFDPADVVARNLSADVTERGRVDATTTLSVIADVGSVPLADQTIPQAGMVSTDVGGEGVEFYQSREYHSSDSINRVDWKRYARTRELTTVEFREDRAATVVVLVDVREIAKVARREDEPDGVSLARFAAARTVSHLLDEGNRVGLAFYGYSSDYLAPGMGDDHAVRVRKRLEPDVETDFPVVPDGGTLTAGGDGRVEWLRKRLPTNAQVLFVTPLLDDEPVDAARRLQASGHRVRVLAPDVTSTDTSGGTVERIEWLHRLGVVREAGVKVAAWSPDEPIRSAFQRARRRWSR